MWFLWRTLEGFGGGVCGGFLYFSCLFYWFFFGDGCVGGLLVHLIFL